MTASATRARPPHVVGTSGDPFDLDIVVIDSGAPIDTMANSAGGCGATCASGSCTSSGA
ncbi:FxLD family lanthipeptide [Streptomyces sp. NPDC047968]|uniref:FxLD family lanthipeptide n=1 Tax=unclassified Streptomyces TaxID=2593676 RepID=UPI00344A0C2F